MCKELKEIIPDLYIATRPDSLKNATLRINDHWGNSKYLLEIPDNQTTKWSRPPATCIIAGWHEHRSNGLVVISYAYVVSDYQGKGIGKYLATLRCNAFDIMRRGYNEEWPCDKIDMVCRVAPHNHKQQHILNELGWLRLSETIWARP